MEEAVSEIIDVPVVEKKTLETIEGHVVRHVSILPSGYVSVSTVDGLGYTLPRAEYDSLLK